MKKLLLLLVCVFGVMSIPYKSLVINAYAAQGETKTEISIPDTIKAKSAKYKVDSQLANAIIFCESSNNPEAVGNLSKVGKDIGLMQINSYFHEKAAKELGLDIYQLEGNVEYGFRLLSKEGTRPWASSKKCWSKLI